MLSPSGNPAVLGKSSQNLYRSRGAFTSRRLISRIGSACHDLEGIVGHWSLQRLCFIHGARIQTSRSSSVVRITGIEPRSTRETTAPAVTAAHDTPDTDGSAASDAGCATTVSIMAARAALARLFNLSSGGSDLEFPRRFHALLAARSPSPNRQSCRFAPPKLVGALSNFVFQSVHDLLLVLRHFYVGFASPDSIKWLRRPVETTHVNGHISVLPAGPRHLRRAIPTLWISATPHRQHRRS